MIYEYTNLTPVEYPRLLGGLLPAPELALWLWWLAAATLVWFFAARRRGSGAEKEGFAAAMIALAGTYVYSCRWTDEVFINLEHTYNLWHHGRFSFSPSTWVDGTVEFVYHLLLLPAAATRELLIGGNYLLGFCIALAHLALRPLPHRRRGALERLSPRHPPRSESRGSTRPSPCPTRRPARRGEDRRRSRRPTSPRGASVTRSHRTRRSPAARGCR